MDPTLAVARVLFIIPAQVPNSRITTTKELFITAEVGTLITQLVQAKAIMATPTAPTQRTVRAGTVLLPFHQ